MSGKIFYLPVPSRKLENEVELDAATEWLLTEFAGPATVEGLRTLAEKELKRPRDAIHARWAEVFLKETEKYE